MVDALPRDGVAMPRRRSAVRWVPPMGAEAVPLRSAGGIFFQYSSLSFGETARAIRMNLVL
jgi:hypothetical protein